MQPTRAHPVTDQPCPCGCGAYLKSNQKAASDACKKRIRRAAQKAEAPPAKIHPAIKVVARPGDPRRPCMAYFGMMNIQTRYADPETVEIVCGHPRAMAALAALARQLDGVAVVGPGPTGMARIPLAGLQTVMHTRATVEPKRASEPLSLPVEPPSPLLLQRASTDGRASTKGHKGKYRNQRAQETRWPGGVPAHVRASLALSNEDDPHLLPSGDNPVEIEAFAA